MNRTLVIIETETDIVRNVIVIDADAEYELPVGLRTVEAAGARIGWLWNNGDQVDPNPAPPEEPA